MVNVLVTGGAGFIGSTSSGTRSTRIADWHVTTLDKLTYAGRLREPRRASWTIRGTRSSKATSPTRRSRRRSSTQADIVVHFAAETHVDRSIMSAGEFITTDVYGTFVLLEAARREPEAAAVRPDLDRRGLRQRRRGREPRDRRAAAAQSRTRRARRAPIAWPTATGRPTSVPVVITRASNNYGPNQFPEKVIPLFITNAIDDIPVPLYGDGLNERDWLHVADHCRARRPADRPRRARRGLQHRRRQRGQEHRPDAPDPGAGRAGRSR